MSLTKRVQNVVKVRLKSCVEEGISWVRCQAEGLWSQNPIDNDCQNERRH
jgi:hypothetical protein